MHTSRTAPSITGYEITGAEAAGASLVAFAAFAIVLAYVTDRAGLTIAPLTTLAASAAGAFGFFGWLRRDAEPAWADVAAFAGIASVVLGWLLWLAWPDLLPLGGGADLTHHLQLVDYLDRHWRLVHDPAVEAYLGEMVHYTPGAHLLASLAGRWTGTDGFHAVYPLVAVSIAIKVGFVFLIALRVVRLKPDTADHSTPLAILAVVLLFVPRAFFMGSFAHYSYVAQVVSELFAVTMWWAVVVWDEQPSTRAIAAFALSGIGAFLTWPVWIGPPIVALAAIVSLRVELPAAGKLRAVVLACLPIAIVAAVHATGRIGWAKIVRTDAATALPTWSDFTWWFLALAAAGTIVAGLLRRSRATALLVAACATQAAVLYVLAKTNGAVVPYMAIKMAYLSVYPLAVCAALAVATAWRATAVAILPGRAAAFLAWVSVAAVCFIVGRQTVRVPIQPPSVSNALYLAGRWARANVDPPCVDYIVANDDTAYWLHLAVVGNKRMSARTADNNTFSRREAIVRWINPGGLPYAVADLGTIPRDVLAENDQLARFDTAVVIKRRGPSTCAPD